MWLKCGTKIPNEINKVKKSVIFFGCAIYQFSSVFYAKYQFLSVLRGDLLNQHPSPTQGADLRLCR
jgi:hypothetical protein